MSIIDPLKDRDSVSGSTRHFLALPALCHAMDSCVQWRSWVFSRSELAITMATPDKLRTFKKKSLIICCIAFNMSQ